MEVDTEPAARSAIESKNEVDEVDSGHREEKVTDCFEMENKLKIEYF